MNPLSDIKRGVSSFLLYSNLPVGGIAVSFVLGTYALLNLSVSLPLLVLAFCATFLVYQFERAVWRAPEDVVNQPERLAWVAGHQRYVWLSSAMAAGIGIVCLVFLQWTTLMVGLALALLSLAYVLPLLPGERRLKTVWFIKPLAIAGAWAVGGVLLPVLEAGASISTGVITLISYRLFFVLPNTLLADWPDRAGDAKTGLSTPALRLSERQIRHLSLAALLMSLAAAGLVASQIEMAWLMLVDVMGVFWMTWAVLRPHEASRWFYSFVIDLIVAWPVVTAVVWFWASRQ